MSESLDPRKQLKIQQGIRRAEDKLVTDIQTALEDTSSYGDLEESQFRNLVRVAGERVTFAISIYTQLFLRLPIKSFK